MTHKGQTHRACYNRLSKEGGKSQCCDCVPHEDCGEDMPQQPTKEVCECKEMTCPIGCKNNHTHKTFFCDKCDPEKVAQTYPKELHPGDCVCKEVCLPKVLALKEEVKEVCEWEKEFDKELVEMSPLIGRDMHNRPPLYDLEFDKIDEIKSFIHKLLSHTRQEADQRVAEAVKEERREWLNGNRCTNCGDSTKENFLSDMCGKCIEEA